MKTVEQKALSVMKAVTKKQTIDSKISKCPSLYHQPKRPKK